MPMDRSSKQKTNKKTEALNDTTDKRGLIDIHRTFHPKTADYTFFPTAHGTFPRIYHVLGHNQASVNLRKLKTYQASFLTTML